MSGEKHTLTATNAREFHFIVPLFAPFFASPDSLFVLFHPTVGTARPLVEGVDYNLAFQFIGASRACAKPIYGGISFMNTQLAGVITLSYRTLGGEWVLNQPQINTILSDTIVNPRITAWEQVMGTPTLFPVIDHEWNLQDMVGAQEIVDEIRALSLAIANRPVSEANALFDAHIQDMDNPHLVDKGQIGLDRVQNYGMATIPEAIEGTAFDKYMAPATVKAVVAAAEQRTLQAINAHETNYNNPHRVTKSQVVLGDVENLPVITQEEIDTLTIAHKYVTFDMLVRFMGRQTVGVQNPTVGLHDCLDNVIGYAYAVTGDPEPLSTVAISYANGVTLGYLASEVTLACQLELVSCEGVSLGFIKG